ncbi:hypothetical protein BS78_08G015600 [Paspalum vaginatum]|nr:hypothetical protein BS78_08G015600 [Paspalum vaginatum]
MATRVHPNTAAAAPDETAATTVPPPPTVLTVWRKSLLFNCAGYTVFDARGDLAFRVDCYGSAASRSRREVVLMDAAGAPLLTVRRRSRLRGLLLARSSRRRWAIYDGDAAADAKPLLSVRRGGGGDKTLAHVAAPRLELGPCGAEAATAAYVVEGSYRQRACAVRDARGGAVVAEVRRKESVGDDVFRLVVADPRLMGAPLAMGLLISLDQMFGR